MKNVETPTGTSEASNIIQEMEERLLGIEDTIENRYPGQKKKIKLKVSYTKHPGNLDAMEGPNLRLIQIEEGEEFQLESPENIFNKITVENFPNRKNAMSIKIQEAYKHHERKFSKHIIIKTLSIHYRERILKALGGKNKITYKGRSTKITPDFSMRLEGLKQMFYRL